MVQPDELSQIDGIGIGAVPLSEAMARIMQSPWQQRGPYCSPPGRLALAGFRLSGMRVRHGFPHHRCEDPGVSWNPSLVARNSRKGLVDAWGTLQCSPESQGNEEISDGNPRELLASSPVVFFAAGAWLFTRRHMRAYACQATGAMATLRARIRVRTPVRESRYSGNSYLAPSH